MMVMQQKKIKKIKLDTNEILKVRNKSQEQNSAIKNISTFYKSREKVIKLFNDYSKIVSEAKYKIKYGEGLKIITPKKFLKYYQ